MATELYTVRCLVPGDAAAYTACHEHAMGATNAGASADYALEWLGDVAGECDYCGVLGAPDGD